MRNRPDCRRKRRPTTDFLFSRLGSRSVPLVVRHVPLPALAFHEPIKSALVQLMVVPCEALRGGIVVAGSAAPAITLILTPLLHSVPKVSRFPPVALPTLRSPDPNFVPNYAEPLLSAGGARPDGKPLRMP